MNFLSLKYHLRWQTADQTLDYKLAVRCCVYSNASIFRAYCQLDSLIMIVYAIVIIASVIQLHAAVIRDVVMELFPFSDDSDTTTHQQ